MFQDLDSTLQALADDPVAPDIVHDADVSFETPDKNFVPSQETINLFLHEVKENREFRNPEPILVLQNGQYMKRQPPIRVDCSYLTTAWSNQTGGLKAAAEHKLLGHSLAWFSRFGTIPDSYFQGSLVGQPYPPPTMVAQIDGKQHSHEFWSALGIAPRLGFNLTVTLALDLEIEHVMGPEVITRELRLGSRDDLDKLEYTIGIAGTVRDTGSNALIVEAMVTIEELERTTQTDMLGRYRFYNLEPGDYTLVTTAAGFSTASRSIHVPGTTSSAYSIELSPS